MFIKLNVKNSQVKSREIFANWEIGERYMKIAVVGSGFVGRATGEGLRKHGHEVTFLEVDERKIQAAKKAGFDAFTPEEYPTITTDMTMFCVPTPTKGSNIQLTYLRRAAMDFAERLKTHNKYHVVVVRSTVPPKTTRESVGRLIEEVSGKKIGDDFGLCMQPEYLREVTANEDYERPWFVLIGEYDTRSGNILEKVYKSFDAPIQRCTLEEAEFQKYVHNVFNAAKIAFFNEMRIAARREGWDADKVFQATAESCEGIWNPMYGLRDYGPYDGSCLPKDTCALLEWGTKNGYKFGILKAIIEENFKHERLLGKNERVRVNYLADVAV
jgi:UDPglucose 6-dehydrogenase